MTAHRITGNKNLELEGIVTNILKQFLTYQLLRITDEFCRWTSSVSLSSLILTLPVESSQWIAALGTGIGGERDTATCFAHPQRVDSKDKNTGDTRTVYPHSQDHLFMFSILCFILKII